MENAGGDGFNEFLMTPYSPTNAKSQNPRKVGTLCTLIHCAVYNHKQIEKQEPTK